LARFCRNGGLGRLEPREGIGNIVQAEVVNGGPGFKVPQGTRDHSSTASAKFTRFRNGVPFVAYDPSAVARAADPAYRHAREALARAAVLYGPRPETIRGLPEAAAISARAGRRRKPKTVQA